MQIYGQFKDNLPNITIHLMVLNMVQQINTSIRLHQCTFIIQSNLRLRPPLLSDQFSKIPKVSQSNHYIWNLL